MPLIDGVHKRIVDPIKNNDPYTLLEGQFGISTVATGSYAWYRPIADNEGDPVPDPIRIGQIDGTINAIGEVPVGVINGVNKIFTVSSDIVNESGSFLTLDGIKAKPTADYSTSGTVITFVEAPAIDTELYIVYGLVLAGGVSSWNGDNGAVVPKSGDYNASQITSTGPSTVQEDLDALDALVAGATPVVVNTSTHIVGIDTRFLWVDYTITGACEVTIPTAFFNLLGVELEIHDSGGISGVNNITIVSEAGETINGDPGGVSIASNYGVVRLRMATGKAYISGGAI